MRNEMVEQKITECLIKTNGLPTGFVLASVTALPLVVEANSYESINGWDRLSLGKHQRADINNSLSRPSNEGSEPTATTTLPDRVCMTGAKAGHNHEESRPLTRHEEAFERRSTP